jgi:hypothetical protein
MNNLYNELMNGSVEFKDGGIITQHPPTSLMLRAARALKQMADTNDNNMALISQIQGREQSMLETIANYELQIRQLTLEKEQYGINQSIRDSEQKTSDVGSSNGGLPGGD